MSHESEASDHYFSGDPKVVSKPRETSFTHDGRRFTVTTDRGVFAYGSVDLGTQVLLDSVPEPSPGAALDVGCGAGTIAIALASHQGVGPVYAIDTNTRALELTRSNVVANKLTDVKVCLPDDVPDDVEFATIWSNPPIRIGKEALHALLMRWLPRLSESGTGWLVVQKNLGADSLQRWLQDRGFDVERTASRKGFRVLRVTQARSG